MTQNYIKIGYMNTRNEKRMKLLTPEVLEQLMTSAKVREIMARIEAEPDQDKKSEYKNLLPVVLFQCRMTESGERPKKENNQAVASGFCMHDWDHMPVDPRRFYEEHIAGKEKDCRIVMVHVTPRGSGLRIVTTLQNGEGIAECQARLAEQWGMGKYADKKIIDLTRLSFLPSKEYLLYLDVVGLFNEPIDDPTNGPVNPNGPTPTLPGEGVNKKSLDWSDTNESSADGQIVNEVSADNKPVIATPNSTQGTNSAIASSFSYKGIKYSAIIEALLKRLATQGSPREGERNNVLFMLVRELRHICEYNFQTVYMLVAPYFPGLDDAEIRRTIGSAIATTGRTITPMLQGVLNELQNENDEAVERAESLELPKLPKVSDIEEMIIAHYPKHLRSQVFMAMLPIWGVYGTNIRFEYLDGRENSLSFMTAVTGKSGSGKAFAAHLFEQMTQRIRVQDALERQKADEYVAMCNKASEASEKPDDPRPRVKIYGDDITTNQLLEYLDNLKGEHGIQFTEEVARLQKAKRTIYGDNDDLYCKAFDNAVGGKESKSKQTRNINIPIFLNTLFCGTPGAMHKFYNNPEGGLNNRIIFAFMPKARMKGIPRYEKLTEDERAKFDEVCNRLMAVGKGSSKIELPWLEKAILLIKNHWDKEDDENPDEVWYDLGKRSLVVAMRVGVLQWYLRGCPTDEKQIREIVKVVKWFASAMRQGIYAFSGQDYEEINETDNLLQQKQVRMTKNKKLFSLLADVFTTQDLVSLRIQNGANANVAMVLSRWVGDGLIRKVGDGRYQKIRPTLALPQREGTDSYLCGECG